MITPLPRNKRAKNPAQAGDDAAPAQPRVEDRQQQQHADPAQAESTPRGQPDSEKQGDFSNSPFAQVEINR
jgi:hypothetical protein